MPNKRGCLRLNSMADVLALKNRVGAPYPQFPKSNKFHAKEAEADGIKFHSKKEARQFRELQARQHNGEIKFFLMQVPFLLPGIGDNGKRLRHYLDFLAVRNDGEIEYIEVKGRDLPVGKLKRRMVEELYGITIQVV